MVKTCTSYKQTQRVYTHKENFLYNYYQFGIQGCLLLVTIFTIQRGYIYPCSIYDNDTLRCNLFMNMLSLSSIYRYCLSRIHCQHYFHVN